MEEAKLVWLAKQDVPNWCGLDGCIVDPAAEGYGDVVLGPGYGPYVGAVLDEACANGVQVLLNLTSTLTLAPALTLALTLTLTLTTDSNPNPSRRLAMR